MAAALAIACAAFRSPRFESRCPLPSLRFVSPDRGRFCPHFLAHQRGATSRSYLALLGDDLDQLVGVFQANVCLAKQFCKPNDQTADSRLFLAIPDAEKQLA